MGKEPIQYSDVDNFRGTSNNSFYYDGFFLGRLLQRPVIIIHDSEVATAQAATKPRILETETGEDISNCLSVRPNLGPRGATETFGPRRRGPRT